MEAFRVGPTISAIAHPAMIPSVSSIPIVFSIWATILVAIRDVCYVTADRYRDGASSGRFDDSVRLRLDGDDLEFGVDFQAFVVDLAGNVGFSDSDPDDPYFINDLGREDPKERIVNRTFWDITRRTSSVWTRRTRRSARRGLRRGTTVWISISSRLSRLRIAEV